jgi:hypothetical protein
MRAEGILVGEPRQDYRTLTYLLTTVAGAVSLPAEFWISAYWVVIRACGLLAAKPWVERQTQLLAAYQACRYRTAVNRLLELAA